MLYYLSGANATLRAMNGTLTPVKSGLARTLTRDTILQDAVGRRVSFASGRPYLITGTKDGNGYVVTFQDGTRTTHYFSAAVGCKLC